MHWGHESIWKQFLLLGWLMTFTVHPFCISIPFDPFDSIFIYSILLLDGNHSVCGRCAEAFCRCSLWYIHFIGSFCDSFYPAACRTWWFRTSAHREWQASWRRMGIGLGCKRTMDMKASENKFFFWAGSWPLLCILFAFLSLSIHLISFLYIASFYWMVTSLCVADVDRHFVVVHFDTFIF